MLIIQNDILSIECLENGSELVLTDRKRGVRWALDEDSLVYAATSDSLWGSPEGKFQPLVAQRAKVEDGQAFAQALTVTYRAGEAQAEVRYKLHKGYAEARLLEGIPGEVGMVTLPGSFKPQGKRPKLLLPIMQGMLWDGGGPAFEALRGEGSHIGFSMAFIGYLGERGGLLATAETRDDCRWWFGKDEEGRTWATNVQLSSLGSLKPEREVRLYVTDADVVAVAKQYRRKVIEQGRFQSWDEKIADRPGLERLFGALMCFIGYCQDEIDYAANCRKLKDYGFERALVYPGRFNIYHPDIQMGGAPAIDLDRQTVEAIRALGYEIAPWSWLNEALDTGEAARQMYRRDPQDESVPHWAIDDQQWHLVCYSFLEEYQRQALRRSISDMTWDHFDVLACVPPMECYAADHPAHFGRPAARGEDREWVRQAFLADRTDGRMVSSENFNDAYALELDLGSVKAWPQYGPWPFWPVPLTMLVYHDSLVHSWWEIHNYNNPWHGRTAMTGGLFEYGGGRPRLMAAMDALLGCPPDVFPFGAQYSYTGRGKETFLYHNRFEDPQVQVALQAALPVAQLHHRTGKLEMVHFKILSENGYVQETAFSDGTCVAANFSQDFAGTIPDLYPGAAKAIQRLGPESWMVVE